MTLAELYDSIDWSGTEAAYDKWAKGREVEEEVPGAFKESWRTTLLLFSLPREMLPFEYGKEWTEERKAEARYLLHSAGVWPQVTKWLVENNLIEEKKDADTDR